MPPSTFLVFFFLLHLLFSPADSRCPQRFDCGEFGPLEFPLTDHTQPECGLFMVNCANPSSPSIQLADNETRYDILRRLSPNKFRMRSSSLRRLVENRSCLTFGTLALTLPDPVLTPFSITPNLTVVSCELSTSNIETVNRRFGSYRNYKDCEGPSYFTVYYQYPPVDTDHSVPDGCYARTKPRNETASDSNDIFDLLSADFDFEWSFSDDCRSCHRRGGQCLSTRDGFFCRQGKSKSRKILLVGGSVVTALTTSLVIIWCIIKGKYMEFKLLQFREKRIDKQKDFEFFLKNYRNIAPNRYKYSDLRKMTKSFTNNLGKGGYGSVYKGQLPDGSLVAVKMLNVSKGNGEDFMNEVASISRTSHINVVTLVGFCFEGSKRALIYEFMPNGSLEKVIHHSTPTSERPGWEKLFDIVLGIARGLEYLHKGCNTRILHFDIKPHNILLDKDLNPKISDFGLAKLCPNRSSIVKMSEARGTVGYIAPEVFCRNFGEVSYKSDVYSYGMMVLEIVGTKKTNDLGVDHSSENYFPHYIYRQLEAEAETSSIDGITVNLDESQSMKRKLTIVGLWCIQTNPRDRPSMSRVIEMLDSKLELLQIPPKPYLSSPERSVPTHFYVESILSSTA